MTAADLIALAKKHTTSTICVFLSLVSGALIYLRADLVDENQKVYEARSAEAAKMAANVKNTPGLAEQVTEIQDLGKELDARLVRASQLAVNLQYFYKLEAENGVKLLDVRQNTVTRGRGTPASKASFAPVPFTLTVEGPYAQVVKFLGALQSGRHFCRINSAVFINPESTSASANLSLTLNLELLGQP